MTVIYAAIVLVIAGLFIYLLIALLKPDLFP
jgi:K+-transporting ATPase KdpF subunit